jgi:hypothetical protein
VLLALIMLILEVTNTTYIFHERPIAISGSAYTKGEPTSTSSTADKGSSKSTATDKSSDTTQPGDDKSDSGGGTTATLLQPSGDFVSNHHPNLSGQPAPNTITSVCTTTPGATCVIKFTNNGTTKQLAPEAVDRGGSAYWNNWKIQDVGLTEGSWTVTAVASLNGKTVTASDSLQLVVAQ